MIYALVAYATKHHSTAQIAGAIGDTLRQFKDIDVEVLPVEVVQTISPYDAIVLGSAVYAGQWRRLAVRFLKKHQEELAECPVWLFSSGPTDEGDPLTLLDGWKFPESIRPAIERIQPKDIAVFSGKLDYEELGFFEKKIIDMVKAPTGDFRDWDMIHEWAVAIGRELMGELEPA